MSQRSDTIRAAVEQADKAYKEALASLELISALYTAIPDVDALHRQEVGEIREEAISAGHAAYSVKHDLEVMEEDLQALESVRGE